MLFLTEDDEFRGDEQSLSMEEIQEAIANL